MSKPMPMHGGPGMQPRKLDKKTLKRLLSYLKNYKGTIVLVTICILLSAVAGAASSMFLQTLIDDYITPMVGQSSPDFSGFIRALITMAVIYLIGTLSTLIYNRRMVTIAQGTLKTIRDEMFEKMQRLPIRYFDSHTHGDTMSLYTNDTDTLRQMLAQSMGQLISSAFTVVAVFCCMLYISVGLTLVVCVSLFFIMQIIKRVVGKSGAYFVAQQRSLADLDGYIEEMINGQKVIKVFCHEEQSKKEMKQRNTEWEHNAANANGHATSMMPMTNAFGYFLYILLAVIGSYMAIAGTKNFGLTGVNTLSLGMIASFLVLSRNFINPISQMSNQFNSIVNALAGAERIFTFMDEEPEPDDGYVTLVNAKEENGEIVEVKEHTGMWAWKHPHGDGTLTYTKLEGQVVLDHVDFGYTPEKEVLHDITLYAEPGQKVAFVGATGAGKTTMVKLLMRFYDVSGGAILLNGYDVKQFSRSTLRDSFGMVLQDTWLYNDTIRENIRFGRLDATDEEVVAAAKAAQVDHFVRTLPHGYDTVLNEEASNISQGQKQLLTIARTILSNPKILILDEATSSVDTRTELLIQQAMDRLTEGRTSFIIAHRLSTIRNADIILVMKDGDIVETGNHEQLLAKGGFYAELYQSQFANDQEE